MATLHTVFVTYNRLELTKQAIESYLATVSVPYTYVVVDNASTDGTREWLHEQKHFAIFLDQNRYPGYAANRGWECLFDDTEFLQRADNDMAFLGGWWEQVERWFRKESVGQVGMRTNAEEMRVSMNVGGNCVIRRKLWDEGLRYDERPWPQYPTGMSEDSYFSPEVVKMGYRWERVRRPALQSLATGDWNDPYMLKSHADRHIYPPGSRQPQGRRYQKRTR